MEIFLIITYTVAKENQLEFIQNFSKLIEKSRRDKGCIWYSMTQSLENENTYKLIERWQSQADLDNHISSLTMDPYRMRIGPLVISSHKEILSGI
jgi:quinol monooxygenase YgiN